MKKFWKTPVEKVKEENDREVIDCSCSAVIGEKLLTESEMIKVMKTVVHALKLENSLIGKPSEIDWDWEYANLAHAIYEKQKEKMACIKV